MLTIRYHNSFKKDFKRMIKRGCDVRKFEKVLEYLINQEPLPPKYKDHALIGDFAGLRECHIQPDWLLVYCIDDTELVLYLVNTGTHSDLF